MVRLLVVAALLVFVVFAARRAFSEGRTQARRPRDERNGQRPLGVPEQLVCGVCGTEFEPDKSGWICPKCRT